MGPRSFLQILSRFKIYLHVDALSRLSQRKACVIQSCQSMSDNMADNSGISYKSGLHQLNEVRLNIYTALKPFEMDEEKEGFHLKPQD